MAYECAACIAQGLMLKKWMPSYLSANSITLSISRNWTPVLSSGTTSVRRPPTRQNVKPSGNKRLK